MNEEATERRLAREATTICLGTLGNRDGANVAKVEVSWYSEYDDGIIEAAGYYVVHATGNEPECEGPYGTIYNVFSERVHEAMTAKQDAGTLDDYRIDDIYSY